MHRICREVPLRPEPPSHGSGELIVQGMTPAEALGVCELTVRRVDPDRYFSTLFAPAAKRPFLFVLYAFNHEIARASQSGSEPSIGEVRLQWWREVVDEARRGRAHAHPVAVALMEVLSRTPLEFNGLDALIEARETEVSILPFATLAAMESHAEATSSALMRMAAGLLANAGDAVELTREAGIAYGLTGMLRSTRFYAERGKLFLPEDLLVEACVTRADVLAGKRGAALRRVFDKVGASAMHHFLRGKAMAVPRIIFPAVLPTALVPIYCARLMKSDPLRARPDISQMRRQFMLLRAVLRQRL